MTLRDFLYLAAMSAILANAAFFIHHGVGQ